MFKISVIMPVYNTDLEFLRESVESILKQTFYDFEFIIIDDGSKGDTLVYLNALSDPRIRIIHNGKNIGITKSLNIGFKEAKGEYLARMDADDISLPRRFEKQLDFMERHPDVIVCGTGTENIGNELNKKYDVFPSMDEIRAGLVFTNGVFRHPTAFFRGSAVKKFGLFYDENLRYAQDYDMWVRVSRCGIISCIQETLLLRHPNSARITVLHRKEQIECDKVTQRRLLEELLGNITENELDNHYYWSEGCYHEAKMTPEAKEWYRRLIRANQEKKIYNVSVFENVIYQKIKNLIYQTMNEDMKKMNKLLLLFRYLPFSIAIEEIMNILETKLGKK